MLNEDRNIWPKPKERQALAHLYLSKVREGLPPEASGCLAFPAEQLEGLRRSDQNTTSVQRWRNGSVSGSR